MPIDHPTDADESRRHFLGQCANALQAAAVGGLLAPLLSSCGSPRIATVRRNGNGLAANVALLVADGMSATLDVKGPDGKAILLIRESAESYIALSMRCTHKGCEVSPPEDSLMVCPCHGSQFDLTGAVVRNPAPAPLKRYQTTYQPDERVVLISLE